jgi:hypothetical protein
MSANEAVKQKPEVVETPQENETGRERSTIAFPYNDLDDAVALTKDVHAVGGSSCQWDQLAARCQQAANGGAFRLRAISAKMFGLLTYDRGTVTLTQLGTRICDPDQEKAARVEAFLTIPLYKAIYEQFKGATLPPTSGLDGAIGTLGVGSKVIGKARQVFQRSAKQAGFFEFGNTRLVMPSIKASATSTTLSPEEKPKEQEEVERNRGSRSGGGGEEYHPFIQGLLRKLPPAETDWPMEGRSKWLQAAINIFDLMYTDSDDSRRSISIELKKDSAK